ncbi:mechanosensitive ion channel domain-containing protein [Thalassoglobus polymorphus]|uniref:Mechanosensitive channel MscK n=1 Tax=Thalassoglobus polymorphus TaxID=2527994 RepID=A0A517QRZ8_9PLAN|nr:mechanosensitive ion channel domain-containing protein [Thalassoglobus polymorphus]QDT34391.1 Mechanosensitive channel MscK precursor [Thalassoglobus polymorphus]
MRLISYLLLLSCFLLNSLSLPIASAQLPVIEQAPDENEAARTQTVTREGVDSLKTQIESSAELKEEEKQAALSSIQNAIVELTTAAEYSNREQAAKNDLSKVDDLRNHIQSELADLKKKKPETPPNDAELVNLGQDLAVKKAELAEAQTNLSSLEARIEGRTERQRAKKDRLAAIPAELEATKKKLTQLPSPEETTLISKAEQASLLATKKRLELEPTMLQTELSLSSAKEAVALSQMERELANLRVDRLKQEVQAYTDAVNTARRENAKTLKEDITLEAERALDSGEPWKKELAGILTHTTKIIDVELSVQNKLQALQKQISESREERESLAESLAQVKSRESRIGSSRSFGMRLRQQRSTIPDVDVLNSQIRSRSQTYEQTQIRYFETREERKKLDNLEEKIAAVLPNTNNDIEISDEDADEIDPTEVRLREALTQQREALDRLILIYDQYAEELDNYNAEQAYLIQLSNEITTYIDRRVLWIRSHDPLSIRTLTSDINSLRVLFDSDIWQKLIGLLFTDFWSHLFVYSLMIVIWGFLIVTQSRQSRRIQQTGKKAASRLNTSMKPTVQSMLMTFSKSLLLPLPILFIGWRLNVASNLIDPNLPYFPHFINLSSNLLIVATGLFCLEFIRNVHRPQGLAQSHFNWPKLSCEIVAKQTQSFLYFVTPLVVMIAVLTAWNSEGEPESLSRIFSIAVYLLLASALHQLVGNEKGAISPWVNANRNGWTDRFSTILHFLSVAVPVALATLTASGFTYASDRLALKLAETIMLIFGVLFIRALFLRWLTFRHRRLAIEEAREARAALARIDKDHETARNQTASEIQESKSILAEVSAQSRRLLNTSVVVFLLVGVWFIWTDVLPALHYFDDFTLPGTDLRLPNLLVAIVVAILTATAARNIPGLLQITLLEWLPIEKSSRYAIGALIQYGIAVIGILAISEPLNIGWDKVQWLAAALTFGLGFGLQEIFANFVSGLIILFEQPVRIGDVVTIDGVSGIVNRIRIRSTTIVDWDRKEYIVPNREFITGKLLNWTLSDSTTRIVLQVGVAYGTDPETVREMLLKIIRDQPHVMRDPSPSVTFDTFGDSSLDFTLRAFLPNLDNRVETIHQLNVEINRQFSEAGIEIPFPQRDLHVRSSVHLPITNDASETHIVTPQSDAEG